VDRAVDLLVEAHRIDASKCSRYSLEWHRKRYLVLLGMTGLWQISGRSNLSFDDLVRYDFYYLDNRSIWLDI